MTPLFFLPQGSALGCPDCGAQGVHLPIIDEGATAGYERPLSPMGAAAPHVPHRFLAAGLILSCALCGQQHRADLDHAEDPHTWVWRISRTR